MQSQGGFIGASVLIAILVGLAVLGGGAYYIVHQQSSPQTVSDSFDNVQTLPPTKTPPQTTAKTPALTAGSQTPITESNISFSASRASEINPDRYSFYATLPAGTSYSEYSNYSIEFGDGEKEQGSGCIDWCSGPSWYHTYQIPGTYVARLIGRDGKTIKSVTVTPRKTTYPTASVDSPDAQWLILNHGDVSISGTSANTATIRVSIRDDKTAASVFESGFFDASSGKWSVTTALPIGIYFVAIFSPGKFSSDSNVAIGTMHLQVK